jgi:hypothetical protein
LNLYRNLEILKRALEDLIMGTQFLLESNGPILMPSVFVGQLKEQWGRENLIEPTMRTDAGLGASRTIDHRVRKHGFSFRSIICVKFFLSVVLVGNKTNQKTLAQSGKLV